MTRIVTIAPHRRACRPLIHIQRACAATDWFLVPTLGIERTVEFVRTIPKSGITEIVDRKLVDLFKRGRKVTTEPSDGRRDVPVSKAT